jgi:alanine dehydrogenase
MDVPEHMKIDVSKLIMPQAEMLEIAKKKKELFIGIPKERSLLERRIALIPDAVDMLVKNGHRVIVETGAGDGANFSDSDFSEAGAEIAYDIKKVYEADTILKVDPPTKEEIDLLKPNQTVISAILLAAQKREYFKSLMHKKVTAIAYESLQDESGLFPIVRSMSEIAGNTSVIIAGQYLTNAQGGAGQLFGGLTGIPPTEIVIIGSGTVAEYATRSALGLGARVKVFDISIERLRRFQGLFQERIYTAIIKPKILEQALKEADVVIGAIRPKKGRSPIIVTEEMVQQMKQGSIIIDVSIDMGGCVETSELRPIDQPCFKKYGVIHYGVPNIGSMVSRTASYALSNVFAPFLLNIGNYGGVTEAIKSLKYLENGVYIYRGKMCNEYIAELFNIPFSDISLHLGKFR